MTDYNVKLSNPLSYKATFGYIMPQTLNDLVDVEINQNKDKYVLMYDEISGKWRDVNPDEVLNAAAETELTQPGFVGYATAFLDRLDIDLDNRIDVDAGSY